MRLLLSCVMVLALAFPAMAAQGGFQGPGQAPGGFQGPTSGVQADTVAKALKAWDDAPVMLTGHIVERVAGSDDKYNFRDATGTIVVEIDHESVFGNFSFYSYKKACGQKKTVRGSKNSRRLSNGTPAI